MTMNGLIAVPGALGAQVATVATVPIRTIDFPVQPGVLRDDYPPAQTLADVIKAKSGGKKGRVLFSTEQAGTRQSPIGHGLLSAMRMAYSQHIPLRIRPDDIWLSVAAAFGIYVQEHSEEMRHLFVGHEGSRDLAVEIGGTTLSETTEDTWATFFDGVCRNIGENVKDPELVAWAAPNFATTTAIDRAASQILLMGSLQKYFGYKMILLCGLPQVTLVGDTSDWRKLRSKVDYLSQFGGNLAEWSGMLAYTLDKLVAASEGEKDEEFWQKMITAERLGSGGQEKYAGWFTVFAPFNDEFRYVLTDYATATRTGVFAHDYTGGDIPSATVSVPVTVVEKDGTQRSTDVYAGVNLPHYDAERNALSPSVGWGVFEHEGR